MTIPQDVARTSFDGLTVGDAMHAGVFTCAEDASLETAAAMMAGRSIHCVVVAAVSVGAFRDWCLASDAIMAGIAIAALLRMRPARRPLSEATR